MKINIVFLLSLFVIILSCNSSDDSENPIVPNQNFSILWETQTNTLPQGIIVDEMGRDFLFVSMKAGGVSVFNKSTGAFVDNIAITDFGSLHAMHVRQQGNYLYVALGDFFWK